MEFTDSKDINCFLNSNYENKSLFCSLVCSKLARVASVSMRCRGTRNESQRPRENSDFGSHATSRNRGSFSKQGPEKPGYSRISVHIICLITYAFLSFSDQANPNIEKVNNFSYSVKIWPRYTEKFQRNYRWQTRNFTKKVCAYQRFCHPAILQFSMAAISFVIASWKSWKLHKMLKLINSFNLCTRWLQWGRQRFASA